MFDRTPVWASNNSVTSRTIEQQQINFHKQEKKTYERRIKKKMKYNKRSFEMFLGLTYLT